MTKSRVNLCFVFLCILSKTLFFKFELLSLGWGLSASAGYLRVFTVVFLFSLVAFTNPVIAVDLTARYMRTQSYNTQQLSCN